MSNDPPVPAQDASVGDLVSQMSEQTSRLVRDEMRLAQIEMTQKGKRAGIGIGMFGGAGLFAFFGFAALVTAAILGLAKAVADWLAAVIIGLALFAIAGVAALMGKREVQQAGPPVPEEAVRGLKQDVQTLKPGSSA
ncbi:MAG TPA: phage holin family protein [Jatrophihabitantaceae bacterium]|jgi:hypothetical protein